MNAKQILEALQAQFPDLFDGTDVEVDCADVVMVLSDLLPQWTKK